MPLVLQHTFDTDPLTEARERREQAARAYREAKARNDSRDAHHAFRDYRAATAQALRVELGR